MGFSRRLMKWLICLLILIVMCWISLSLRSYLLHILKFAISSEYRGCVHLRHTYEAESQTTPLYITLAYHGRLGNWLYSYASLLGIAKVNGYVPYLEADHPLYYTFQLSKLCTAHANCLLTVTDPLPCGYVPEFNHLPAANVSIDGYIQSWKYFQFMEDEIRKEFRFQDHLQKEIRSVHLRYVSKYLNEGRTIISVHVRRGDKLSKGFQGLGFKPAPLQYFKNAMNYMARKYPFSAFMILSDDLKWCRENLKPITLEFHKTKGKYSYKSLKIVDWSEDNDVEVPKTSSEESVTRLKIPIFFTEGHSSSVDLGLLTLANHSIISVGTFGWWGAWLANGTVVYYKNHVIPGSVLDSQTVNGDFFPPHWVPMSTSNVNFLNIFIFVVTLAISLKFCMVCP